MSLLGRLKFAARSMRMLAVPASRLLGAPYDHVAINQAAETAAGIQANNGYQDCELIEVIFAKNAALTDEQIRAFPYTNQLDIATLAVTYAATLSQVRPLRVLDFGGSFAFHHRIATIACPHIPVRWAIVETAEMVERAREISVETLQFFSNVEAAIAWLGSVDLVFSSGAVQYLAAPELMISQLERIGAPIVVWNRMTFCDDGRISERQRSLLSTNGPGPLPSGFVDREVFYNVTRIEKADFMQRHPNYDLVWQFNSEYPGFVFVRRSHAR